MPRVGCGSCSERSARSACQSMPNDRCPPRRAGVHQRHVENPLTTSRCDVPWSIPQTGQVLPTLVIAHDVSEQGVVSAPARSGGSRASHRLVPGQRARIRRWLRLGCGPFRVPCGGRRRTWRSRPACGVSGCRRSGRGGSSRRRLSSSSSRPGAGNSYRPSMAAATSLDCCSAKLTSVGNGCARPRKNRFSKPGFTIRLNSGKVLSCGVSSGLAQEREAHVVAGRPHDRVDPLDVTRR